MWVECVVGGKATAKAEADPYWMTKVKERFPLPASRSDSCGWQPGSRRRKGSSALWGGDAHGNAEALQRDVRGDRVDVGADDGKVG